MTTEKVVIRHVRAAMRPTIFFVAPAAVLSSEETWGRHSLQDTI